MKGKKKDTERIGRWSHDHKNDAAYRKAQAEGSRRYQQQLYRDAAFGRIARTLLGEFGELFKKLVAEEEKVDQAAALAAAGAAEDKETGNNTKGNKHGKTGD